MNLEVFVHAVGHLQTVIDSIVYEPFYDPKKCIVMNDTIQIVLC